tara:strand:+ start:4557 stop:6473 length:1917 start_codon:yes stop_codon:yes gene_type:complete
MKKLLLSACALLVVTIVFGQSKMFTSNQKTLVRDVVNSPVKNSIVNSVKSAAPTPIWSDNFDDPTNWVIDHDPNACSLDWQIGINSCQGSYPINDIVSTTANNGWAMIDSDFYGGATGGTEVEDCWLTTANPIDLNGYPNVVLEFETQYRSYNSEQTYIVVGVGDGTGNVTWPDLDPTTIITGMSNVFKPFEFVSGDQTTNPELVTVDISSALVGLAPQELADIYIRFHWTGTWGYAWFVDDVSISKTPDNKIRMSNEVVGGFWIDYANYTGSGLNDIYGLDYSVTPLTQLANHPYVFEALVKNQGLSQQHAVLKYDVTGAGTASGTSSVVVLESQEDSAFTTTPFSPSSVGNYSVDIFAEGDSAGAGITMVSSDIVTKNIEITNYIYGKDLGVANSGQYQLGGTEDQNHFTTRYEMYANEQLYAIRAYIGADSDIGAEVKAIIYELDSTAADGLIFLDESDNYTIAAGDLGNWVDIPFLNPISLIDGYAYECGIVGYNHPSLSSYLGTSGSSLYNGEHSVFDELGLSTQSAGTPTWYYTTSTPMARMNFDPSLISEVSDVRQMDFNVFPNPTNGLINIELESAKKYMVSIYNVLGQVVLAKSVNTRTVIDLSILEKGVYTIEAKGNDVLYTEKIILE